MAKLYFRKKLLLAKLEVTHGLDPVPTGAANAIQTRDLTISPLEATALDLQLDKQVFGSNLGTLIGRHVLVTFKVPVAGSGTAGTAPAWGILDKACGETETLVAVTSAAYTPLDDDPPSLTMYVKADSTLHKVKYCRGGKKLTVDSKGYPWWEYSFMGLYTAPITASAITPVYTAWIKPVPFRATTVSCSLAGQVVGLFNMTIDFGQKVEYYEHSEEESVQITDRAATFQATFEETPIATHDFFADIIGEAAGALSFVHGIVAGNIVTVESPQSQITKVSRTQVQGVNCLQVSGPLVASEDGTEPDYTITCT